MQTEETWDQYMLLDAVPVGILVLQSDMTVLFWNNTLARWTGVSREAITGRQIGEFFPDLVADKVTMRLSAVFEQGAPAIFSSQIHRYLIPVPLGDDQMQSQKVTVTALPSREKDQYHALFSVEDVTDLVDRAEAYRRMRDQVQEEMTCRLQGEEEIRRKNKELSILHQITQVTTSSASVDELVTHSLGKVLSLLNFEGGGVYLIRQDRQEIADLITYQGLRPEFVRDIRSVTITQEPFRTVMIEGQPWYCMDLDLFAPQTKAAGFKTLASIPLVADDQIVGAMNITTVRDHQFTPEERSVLESIGREIGAAIVKTELQQQVQSAYTKANLYLDIISHDVNNAITSMMMYATLLTETLDGEDLEIAERLLSGTEKSAEIIRNVSTIRRIHENHAPLRRTDLVGVIRSEAEHFGTSRITCPEGKVFVMADDLVAEIFTNLIGNSLKFGEPSVKVQIQILDLDGMVEVSIVDDGPGIPDSLKEKIFNRFQRGENGCSGKGLGLFITRSLVERYGGTIRIEDRVPGDTRQGTAIKFTLAKWSPAQVN
jgi:two-component system, OmpR family, sensor histidine kinase KdpD